MKDKLIETIREVPIAGKTYEEYVEAVAEKLAYQAEVRLGEWETVPDYQPDRLTTYRHICSVCKTTYKDIRPHGHNYCHNCGAKMKGANNEHR